MPKRSMTISSSVSSASNASSRARRPSPQDRLLVEGRETKRLRPSRMAAQHTGMTDVLPESFLHLYRKQQDDVDELMQECLQKQHDTAQIFLTPWKLVQAYQNDQKSLALSDRRTQATPAEAGPEFLRELAALDKPSPPVKWLSLKDLPLFRGDADSLEDFLAQLRHCQEQWSDDKYQAKILRCLPLCMAGPAWPWYQRLSKSFKDEKLKDLAGWEYELRREFSDGVPAEVGPVPAEEHRQPRTLVGEARGLKPEV